jgi:ABC-type branched-subunit amino acid transport system substrate-binding protein
MSIICFHVTGTAKELRIITTFQDNNNQTIGTNYSFSLAPFPTELRQTMDLRQELYNTLLDGTQTSPSPPPVPIQTNNPNSTQSGVDSLTPTAPPIPIQTNNPIYAQCQRLGDQIVIQSRQWIDTPPSLTSKNVDGLRVALSEVLSRKNYEVNPNNHSFILHTDTGDDELDIRLQKLPLHMSSLIANYPNAELTFSVTNHQVSPLSSGDPKILVILGYDASISFDRHEKAIKESLSEFNEERIKYWSCNPNSKHRTNNSVDQPVRDLYNRLEEILPTIVIFVGHSSTAQVQGKSSTWFELNNEHFISLESEVFERILENLKKQGLMFAAFFSCNGLRIAHVLSKCEIPYILVTKDKIPVHVALVSISKFLSSAIQPGVSINVALSKVRQYLETNLESVPIGTKGCPNASNLFALFQNPAQPACILKPLIDTVSIEDLSSISTPPTKENWLQKVKKATAKLFPNRKQKYLLIGIFAVSLPFILPIAIPMLLEIINPYPRTACEDIRNIMDQKGLSCGEKNLVGYGVLNEEQIKVYNDSIKILQSEKPDYEKVVNNLKPIKGNPELSITYGNARARYLLRNKKIESIRSIVVMLPLSNDITTKQEDLPNSILTAVSQAQSQWNSNNEHKWNLEIILVNDNNDSKINEPVKFITQQQKVLGVISHYNSGLTKAFIEYYKNSKLTLISATNTATDLTNILDNYFRITVTTDVQAKDIMEFIRKKGITNVAILSQVGKNAVFANSFEKSILNAAINENKKGAKIKIHPFQTSDSKASNDIVSDMMRTESKAVILNPNSFTESSTPSKNVDIINDISRQCPTCLIVGNEVVPDKLFFESIKKKKGKISNLFISFPWSNTSSDSSPVKNTDGTNFEAKELRTPISHRAFLTYDAIYLLMDAINVGVSDPKFKTDEKIRSALPELIRELLKTSYKGMTGTITLKDKGKGSDRAEALNGFVQPQFDKNGDFVKFIKPK